MPSPAGSNFVVHGTGGRAGPVDYGPYPTFNEAKAAANDAVNVGDISDWTITYTDVHGNIVEYDQV